MTSKPLLVFPNKQKAFSAWRQKERHVTAIVGIQGAPGILLAADCEETVSGYSKRFVDKVTHWDNEHFRFAIGSAGPGHYADLLASKLSVRLQELKSFSIPTIGKTIENVLVEFHKRHLWPRGVQGADDASVQMLVVVQRTPAIAGQQNVFGWSTCETAANRFGIKGRENDNYHRSHIAIGVGSHLASYTLHHLYESGHFHLNDLNGRGSEAEVFILAAYVMRELHLHIANIGKEPDITLFKDDGTVAFFDLSDSERLAEVFTGYDGIQRAAMHFIAACDADPYGVNSGEVFGKAVANVRADAAAAWVSRLERIQEQLKWIRKEA